MEKDRVFTHEQVDMLLGLAKGKTLGEADTKGLIDIAHAANPNKVQKGIAGDVIELSVLGCPKRDPKQKPDIVVDGVLTELKTTGVRKLKRSTTFSAKECITITAVSHDQIVKEEFERSHFLQKIEHLLFAFYHFNIDGNASNSLDYKGFKILGHLFWQAKPEDLEKLRNDWLLVQEFCRSHDFSEVEPRKKLERSLLLTNYSSPSSPRFRFKTSFASSIVNDFLCKKKLETLPVHIGKYSEFDAKCHTFTETYRENSMGEIGRMLGVSIGKDKDSCQRLIVKMFGGKAARLNKVRDFQEMGLAAKTIILTKDGKPTEDMKLFQVSLDEFFNPDIVFKEIIPEEDSIFHQDNEYSRLYSYFAEQSFIFIIFKEPRTPAKLENGKKEKIPLSECIFEGFKRYAFNEHFIDTEARRCWNDARELVFTRTLKEVKAGRGFAPNFPKSTNYKVFFRGSGSTSKDRKPRLKEKWGLETPMYLQSIWIKGTYIVEELDRIAYL